LAEHLILLKLLPLPGG